MKKNIQYYGFSIIPVTLLFGFLLSNICIRLSLLIALSFLLLLGYILFSMKLYYNNLIIMFFIFLLWSTFLLFRGHAGNKLGVYLDIMISAFMMVGIYYYALYSQGFHFRYYIYVYIFISFIIAFMEMYSNLVLPSSGKAQIEAYSKIRFTKIPTSTFFNPNDFATAIGMLFIYTYSYCKMMKDKTRYFVLFCCLYIIYFTGSRGVQLSVILLPLIYSIINKRSLLKLLILYFILFSTILLLFIFGKIPVYTLTKYIYTAENFSQYGTLDNSSLLRWQMIDYSFTHLKELIIGFGPDGSSIFLKEFSIPNPHNFFLEILIDYGFIGFILSLTIFFTSLKINYDLINKDIPEQLRASCKATVILLYLFVLFSVVSSSLFIYWPYAWLPIYLTLINLGTYKRKINSYEEWSVSYIRK